MKILRRKVKCSSSGSWTVSTDLYKEQPEEQNIAEYREKIAPRASGRDRLVAYNKWIFRKYPFNVFSNIARILYTKELITSYQTLIRVDRKYVVGR